MFVVHYSFIWKHNCNNVCRISPNMPRLARMIWQTINVITSTLMGTDLYPHMPILLRAIYCNGVRGPRAGRFVRFGASGGAKFTKRDISCLGRRWTAVQNLTPLASSSAEKSVTVQTNKQTNTHTRTYTNTNSKRYEPKSRYDTIRYVRTAQKRQHKEKNQKQSSS